MSEQWDEQLETRIAYYLNRNRISPECAEAWRTAKAAHDLAIETGCAIPWIEARHHALSFHARTGCTSDKLEWSFNRVSVMDDCQLRNVDHDKYDAAFVRACAVELAKREWRPSS